MQAHWNFSTSDAVICDPDDLLRLMNLMESEIGKSSWEIRCADGVTRKGGDAQSLIGYENAIGSKIMSIRLSARSIDAEQRATVTFGSTFTSLDAELEAPEEVVARLRPLLEDQLGAFRAWYGRLARTDFVNLVVMFMISLWLLSVVLFAAGIVDQDDSAGGGTARGQAIAHTVVVAAIAVGWGLNKLRESLFPSVTFAIGQGRRRHDLIERIQWGVLVAFVVSLLAGVVMLIFST